METIRVTTVKMKGGHIGGTDVKTALTLNPCLPIKWINRFDGHTCQHVPFTGDQFKF